MAWHVGKNERVIYSPKEEPLREQGFFVSGMHYN
jgi:hypothetical protein